MTERNELVRAWIAHSSGGDTESSSHFWAWEEVTDLTHTNVETAWTTVLALVEAAPTDRVLANIAAGPLEDLVREAHGVLIDRIETAARRDSKFRRCLTGVWLSAGMPPEVIERIAKYTTTVKDPL